MLFKKYKNEGQNNRQITASIEDDLNVKAILERSSRRWDGGYAIAGVIA